MVRAHAHGFMHRAMLRDPECDLNDVLAASLSEDDAGSESSFVTAIGESEIFHAWIRVELDGIWEDRELWNLTEWECVEGFLVVVRGWFDVKIVLRTIFQTNIGWRRERQAVSEVTLSGRRCTPAWNFLRTQLARGAFGPVTY